MNQNFICSTGLACPIDVADPDQRFLAVPERCAGDGNVSTVLLKAMVTGAPLDAGRLLDGRKWNGDQK